MEEQLFRFSVLRAPELRSSLSPIAVHSVHERPSDRLSQLVTRTVDWLKGDGILAQSSVGDLRAAMDLPPDQLDQASLAGAVVLGKQKVVSSLRAAAERPRRATRGQLAESSNFLTAAVLLSELDTLDDALPLKDWVVLHPIQIDFSNLFPGTPWLPKQALSREPGICDHFVVREELIGYEMGQIEDIKNYLKGELKNHSLRYLSVSEEESTTENETESERSTETATQQRAEMSAASQETANSSVGLDARVKTDGQYGPTKVSTDVGFQYASSKSEAKQTAAEFSTEVMEKTVSKVKERELKKVVRRTRVELEEIRDHKVDNVDGPGHTIGIYRWVDTVWRATTYSLGPRLVLEFLIPEPGRALEQASSVKPPNPEAPPAPLPASLFANLTNQLASELTIQYGAEGIKSRPIDRQVTGIPFNSAEFKDGGGVRVMSVLIKDLKVPENYYCDAVFVSVTSMDRTDTNVNANVAIDVPGGKPKKFLDDPAGPDNPIVIDGGTGRQNAQLRTIILQSKIQFGPGATVPVTIYSEDSRGLAGVVELHCQLTDAALDQWKLDTIEKLTAAYRARYAEWQARDRAQTLVPQAPLPRPDLDALCRHACISSMLNGWPNAAGRNDASGWPKPGALSGSTGELVEFMEQAFEWHNLQYVAYPYYWADSPRWPALLAYDHADPHVREFVRSGAVRMVVPVRLDLSPAVLFFLATGIPWFGGGAPIPGDDNYQAIADEIRLERTKSKEEEETVVGEVTYTLPTKLTILQENDTLPSFEV